LNLPDLGKLFAIIFSATYLANITSTILIDIYHGWIRERSYKKAKIVGSRPVPPSKDEIDARVNQEAEHLANLMLKAQKIAKDKGDTLF